jgi:host factor-I protein
MDLSGIRTPPSGFGVKSWRLGVLATLSAAARIVRPVASPRKAMTTERPKTLQETFLDHVREQKTPLTIFLVNGIELQGVVASFDNFSITLVRDGWSQLIYKHAVSTTMPAAPIKLEYE